MIIPDPQQLVEPHLPADRCPAQIAVVAGVSGIDTTVVEVDRVGDEMDRTIAVAERRSIGMMAAEAMDIGGMIDRYRDARADGTSDTQSSGAAPGWPLVGCRRVGRQDRSLAQADGIGGSVGNVSDSRGTQCVEYSIVGFRQMRSVSIAEEASTTSIVGGANQLSAPFEFAQFLHG